MKKIASKETSNPEPFSVGLAQEAVETRIAELVAAEGAMADAVARQTAAIELDEPDEILVPIEQEIEGYEAAIKRANDRLKVAEDRLKKAEADAAALKKQVAATQHQSHVETNAPKLRDRQAELSAEALKTVIAIGKAESVARDLAVAAGQSWSDNEFERQARCRFDCDETIISSTLVDLWCDRNDHPCDPQPTNVVVQADGTAIVRVSNSGGGRPFYEVHKRTFIEKVLLPRDLDAMRLDTFAESLNLPALSAGRPAIWDGKWDGRGDLEQIITAAQKALHRLDEQLAELRSGKSANRVPEIRRTLIGTPTVSAEPDLGMDEEV